MISHYLISNLTCPIGQHMNSFDFKLIPYCMISIQATHSPSQNSLAKQTYVGMLRVCERYVRTCTVDVGLKLGFPLGMLMLLHIPYFVLLYATYWCFYWCPIMNIIWMQTSSWDVESATVVWWAWQALFPHYGVSDVIIWGVKRSLGLSFPWESSRPPFSTQMKVMLVDAFL